MFTVKAKNSKQEEGGFIDSNVDFLHRPFGPLYAKNPDYRGCADLWSDGSLGL
jgi:hypothetical protein